MTVVEQCAIVHLAQAMVQQLQHELLALAQLEQTSNPLVRVQVYRSSNKQSPCLWLLSSARTLLTRSVFALAFGLSFPLHPCPWHRSPWVIVSEQGVEWGSIAF